MTTMKKCFRLLCSLCLLAVASVQAAELSAADKDFLAGYEQVRAALAKDDLAAAKTAAASAKSEDADAKKVAAAGSIAEARGAFERMSAKAIAMTSGIPGYYRASCPMAKKDWVQVNTQISNPYEGKSMPDCGFIKK
jgi:hypothetical protein